MVQWELNNCCLVFFFPLAGHHVCGALQGALELAEALGDALCKGSSEQGHPCPGGMTLSSQWP